MASLTSIIPACSNSMLPVTLEFNDLIRAHTILAPATALPNNCHENVLSHCINSEIIFASSAFVSPHTGTQLL